MNKEQLKQRFVKRAVAKHGTKFDYSKVVYQDCDTKTTIVCPNHGEIETTPYAHLNGCGCWECGVELRAKNRADKAGKKFVEKSIALHGKKYDYSEVVYINSKKKVKFRCHKHGIWEMTPNHHLAGQGCPKCGKESMAEKQTLTLEEFIKKAQEIHSGYSYDEVIYVNSKQNVIITCDLHGNFPRRPNDFLMGKGCPKCGVDKSAKSKTLTTTQFIKQAREVHDDLYDYSQSVYDHSRRGIDIICKTHGTYSQRPNDHLSGKGCPACSESKGEMAIRRFLEAHGIEFDSQKRFDDCRDKNALPFDFFIPEYNLAIEFDGRQHYQIIEHFGGEQYLVDIQRRDSIKSKYCIDNSIKLCRIPYTDLERVDKILQKALWWKYEA